jgi:hypothetical protein
VTASPPSVPLAGTPASLRVDALKARITQLRTQETELTKQMERDHRKRDEVREALAEVEVELEVEVLMPVANDVDPTAWLPEELLMAILIQVVTEGICGLVCRRWYGACQDGRVKRRAWEGRWEGYHDGWRVPQKLVGHTHVVTALATGPDGTVYSASRDGTVRAWSGTDGSHLRTLDGPGTRVYSLAVGGPNGAYTAPQPIRSSCGQASMAAVREFLRVTWTCSTACHLLSRKKAPCSLEPLITQSECGLTENMSALSLATLGGFLHSLSAPRAGCTRGRTTRRFECGR